MRIDEMIALTRNGELNPHLRVAMDRSQGFELLVAHARKCLTPMIVETGCVRATNDWGGAGGSTLIFAAVADECDGAFVYIDNEQRHLDTAEKLLKEQGSRTARPMLSDSVAALNRWFCPIDVLYLDSLDTTELGYAEHCLAEAVAAQPHMAADAMIGIDDSPTVDGAVIGKGTLAVPYLVEQGWRVIHAGYQAVLTR